MNRFSLSELPIEGLKVVERKRLSDNRGYLERLFCAEELALAGFDKAISQVNHTHTAKKGTIRGLHFQHPPSAETKLVLCIRGEVWDVAVDVRDASRTYLQWHGELLSAENCRALLIPEGCAHGFQALTDDVELIYFHSAAYSASREAGLHPLDPELGIRWPLQVTELSARDRSHPMLGTKQSGISAK